MTFTIRALLIVTLLGSLAALGISVWPGRLQDLSLVVFILSVCLLPVAALTGAVFVWAVYRRFRRGELSRTAIRELAAIPVIAAITLALLVAYVPRRIAFRAHRQGFEAAVATVPESERGVAANLRIGVYLVDEFACDPRGGTYFRVYSGGDGLGPDTMSYGFVKKPNRSGTPFGAAKYRTAPLAGDWHWFRASNDWH